MNPVTKIIRKNLLGGRAIAIPSYGTLLVQRSGARIVDGGLRLAAPLKEVVLSDTFAVSVVDYIIEELGVDESMALSLFHEWYDETVNDNFMVIDGIGTFEVHSQGVELDAGFASLLNPVPGDKVVFRGNVGDAQKTVIKPVRESNTTLMVLSIIAVILAAFYLVYYFADDLAKLFS